MLETDHISVKLIQECRRVHVTALRVRQNGAPYVWCTKIIIFIGSAKLYMSDHLVVLN